jgi:hypothetical protein
MFLSPLGERLGEGMQVSDMLRGQADTAMIGTFPMSRRFVLGGASLALTACFDRPCHEKNPEQRAFLEGLARLAKPALGSGNPLQVEEAARQSVKLWSQIGAFTDWCGTLRKIEGTSQNVAVTLEIGPQVTLFAFNDWTLALAGSIADLFASRTREAKPPGLSEGAVAALKTFRLGDRVQIAGRMGEIAGSSLFDISSLIGKSEAENRQFLQAPRFVARIESLAPPKRA